jgi:hypothetical protein
LQSYEQGERVGVDKLSCMKVCRSGKYAYLCLRPTTTNTYQTMSTQTNTEVRYTVWALTTKGPRCIARMVTANVKSRAQNAYRKRHPRFGGSFKVDSHFINTPAS